MKPNLAIVIVQLFINGLQHVTGWIAINGLDRELNLPFRHCNGGLVLILSAQFQEVVTEPFAMG